MTKQLQLFNAWVYVNTVLQQYFQHEVNLQLCDACERGDFKKVNMMISNETCDINVCNTDGETLLHIACRNGHLGIVRFLLVNKKCDLNTQDNVGNTSLHLACNSKSLDIIRLLLEKRCSTNICNKKGKTTQNIPVNENGDCLLHLACQWDDVDIVRYLITDERCDLNIQNVYLNTPLHIACYLKALVIIRLLLEKRCSTEISNKIGETAYDIPLNENGDCLLHLACQWDDVDIVRYLITDERCDVNIQNTHLNTPLHIACYAKMLVIIRLLLEKRCSTNISNKKGETVYDIPLNEDGDCLLHFACQWGDVDIIRYLITDERCDVNIQNTYLNTPLHIACYAKTLVIIRLLLEKRCSTNIPNKKGDTAHDIPLNEDGDCLLHIACQWGDVDIVRFLIAKEKCNLNLQSSLSENTPLHIAAMYGREDTIVLLFSYMECDPNIKNSEGDTPLHIAVRQNETASLSQLLAHQQCNINIQNMEGDTLLHIAVREKKIPVISQLLSNKQCNLNVQNMEGDTPLHIAVREGKTPVISQLLSNKQCNLNVQNSEGDTPLHIIAKTVDKVKRCELITDDRCDMKILNNDDLTPLLTAIKHNNPSVATALLQNKKCDPTMCDPHGNTPLHLACIGGETHPEMVELAKQLLISGDVDPSRVNNVGQTPIELTTNYQLIQAISHFVKCKTKQSVQTYINMFIVGNPETGKSTLVKAICQEATSILWKIIPKRVRRVKNVPPCTAGIIPTTFQSKKFGNTVLYDLAGQVEYYSSHAAVIQSTVISTPPAFVVVINLSKSEEEISRTLRYWRSFIDNHATRYSAPPQVILVGSHADVLKLIGGKVQETMTDISAVLKTLPASFHFAGHVALDCRDPASRKLQDFCSLVNKSCTVLRQKADVDLRCHVLYAFLLDKFHGEVACRVTDVATSVKQNTQLLPQNSAYLIPLISTLSDKGLLLLVKGGESNGDWWVILQKQILLEEINGTIFAPNNFRQNKILSWNTGVVPFLKLKNEFSEYNTDMVLEFLIHLEFCFKIEDHETLALLKPLKDEAANVEDTSPDVSEAYYFFPALVSVENPVDVWELNDAMCCKCGWFYKCIQQDQFLTTQFLHVLILRLAFAFALQLDPGDCRENSLFLRRKCSVWKHGIGWRNMLQIETVVEVGLQHQSVVVIMCCPKGTESECVQLRSEVIHKVLEVKNEHCKVVRMCESFINPKDVTYPLTGKFREYSLTGIARAIVEGKADALDRTIKNPLPLQDLLLFDTSNTYTSTELLREIFSKEHSMDEEMRSKVLETLNSEYGELHSITHGPQCTYSINT